MAGHPSTEFKNFRSFEGAMTLQAVYMLVNSIAILHYQEDYNPVDFWFLSE